MASYASHFDRYDDEQLRIGDARTIDQQRTVVASQMTRTDGMSIDIDWLVKNDGHGWAVIDVVVEGISMVITQRSEFGTVITQRGGIDGLLEAIRQRIDMARLE